MLNIELKAQKLLEPEAKLNSTDENSATGGEQEGATGHGSRDDPLAPRVAWEDQPMEDIYRASTEKILECGRCRRSVRRYDVTNVENFGSLLAGKANLPTLDTTRPFI